MILGGPLPSAVPEQSQERGEEEKFPLGLFGVFVRRSINLFLLFFGRRIGEIDSLVLFLLRLSLRPAPAACHCLGQPLFTLSSTFGHILSI